MPSSRSVRKTRIAISPRFATRTFSNGATSVLFSLRLRGSRRRAPALPPRLGRIDLVVGLKLVVAASRRGRPGDLKPLELERGEDRPPLLLVRIGRHPEEHGRSLCPGGMDAGGFCRTTRPRGALYERAASTAPAWSGAARCPARDGSPSRSPCRRTSSSSAPAARDRGRPTSAARASTSPAAGFIDSSGNGVALAPLSGWYRAAFAWFVRPVAEPGAPARRPRKSLGRGIPRQKPARENRCDWRQLEWEVCPCCNGSRGYPPSRPRWCSPPRCLAKSGWVAWTSSPGNRLTC